MNPGPPARFPTTRWSMVGRAAAGETDAGAALAEFCSGYRPPLLQYCARFVSDIRDAEDLVQAFFVKLLEKNFLARADAGRGRLRTFLLTLLKCHIADEYRRETAEKRSGRIRAVSLDEIRQLPCDQSDPDEIFHRRWAMVVLERTLITLRDDWRARGKGEMFDTLRPFLGFSADSDDERTRIAADLGMTQGALNTSIYRLRKEYRAAILNEISETLEVRTKEEAENELAFLLGIL